MERVSDILTCTHCSDGQAYVRKNIHKSIERYWHLNTWKKLSDTRYYDLRRIDNFSPDLSEHLSHIFTCDDYIEDLAR